jgi:hypothetical protein
MQSILIYVILGAALVYIGRKVYLSFSHKHAGGCAHCDPADIDKYKKPAHGK